MYDYKIYVNDTKYTEVHSHQELIECVEQIRVERGDGATYTIKIVKV